MTIPVRQDNSEVRQGDGQPWQLQLFVLGPSHASASAIRNAVHIAREFLPQGSTLDIIDLAKQTDYAETEQVLAIPTLIRKAPGPARRIIGDLGDLPRVLVALGVEGFTQE